MTSIKVAIKVRPLIQREIDDDMAIEWSVNENTILSKRTENAFQFDHIFDQTTTNAEVFDTVVKPVIDAAVNGFNGTVFAYGQTSSGKTFTMMGNGNDPGIIPQTVTQIFKAIESTNREFLLRVAYIEIYNERVNDLLDKDKVDIKVREENGEVVVKCKEEVIQMPENIITLMKRGDKNRRIGKTDMNEHSSRSHSIFRIIIESKETDSDADGAVQVSQLNLVDLAGSERASATGATGERFREGRHINLSLSALGKVIMNLSEKADYVGFRDSKLTRILQASLGGNAMTAIICAVTPASLEETLNTLNFASRAKRIKNKPQLNEVMSDAALLRRYKKQIDTLSQKLQSMDGQTQSDEVKEMANKLEETERMNQALLERINNLQKNIIGGASKSDQESIKKKAKRRQTWAAPARHSLIPRLSMSSLPPIPEKLDLDITEEETAVPLEDFEMEIYQSIKLQEEDYAFELPTRLPKITFSDTDEVTFLSEVSTLSTPRRSTSPGTPKSILREKLNYAIDELETLKEVTSLEKQLRAEDQQNDLRNEFAVLKHQMRVVRQENESLLDTVKTKEESIAQLEKQLENALRVKAGMKANENLMAGDTAVYNQTSIFEKNLDPDAIEDILSLSNKKTEDCHLEKCDLEKCELRVLLKSTEDQLQEFKDQVAGFQAKLDKMEKERNSISEKKKQDEVKILELQTKVQTMEAENFVLTEKMNQLSKMRREKEELIVKKRELEEQNSSFEEKFQSQTEEIEKLKKENENLQKQINESPRDDGSKAKEYEHTIESLKSDKDKLNEELKQKLKQIEDLQLRLNSSEEKLRDNQDRMHVLSQTMESLLSENDSLKSQIVEIQMQFSESEAKTLNIQIRNQELIGQLQILTEKLNSEPQKEDLSENLKELQKKNKDYEIQLTELIAQIESMKQAENSKPQLAAIEAEMNATRKTFEDSKAQLEEQDRMNTETIADLEQKLTDYLDERGKFLIQVKELEELSQGYKDKCQSLELKIEELKGEDKISEMIQEKVKELEKNWNEEKEKNAELLEKFEKEKSEKEQYSKQLEEMVSKIHYYETKIEEDLKGQEASSEMIQGKIEKLEKNWNEEKEKNAELLEKFEKEKSEKEQYSKQLEELQVQTQYYETNIEDLKEEIRILNQNLSSSNEEISDLQELLNQEKQRGAELEQLQVTLKMERNSFLNHIEQIEKQSKACENKLQQFQEQVSLQNELMSDEILKLQELVDEKELEIKQLKSQYEEQQKLLNSIPKSSTPMNTLSTNRDSLERTDVDLNKSQNVIKIQTESSPMLRPMVDEILQKSSQSLNSTSIFNNESYFDKMEMTNSETFSEVDSATDKSMLLSMKKQIQDKNDIDIENHIKDMKESIMGLQKIVVALSSENDHLTENLNKARTDFKTLETELQNTIRQLKEQNSTLSDERNELESKLIASTKTIETMEELKSLLAIYETEINNMKAENENLLTAIQDDKESQVLAESSVQSENDNLSQQLLQKIEEVEALKQSHVRNNEQLQDLETTSATALGELRKENETLNKKIANLEKQIERLGSENDQLSTELMEKIEDLERHPESAEDNSSELLEKIKSLQSEVEQLTEDNKKLANYKDMKTEVKYLNKQLKEMQKKYEQNVAVTESLRTKAKESLDESLMNESLNVSMIQEKVEHVDSEFDCLKDVHSLLSISFNKKCEEIERLQAYISSEAINAEQNSKKDKIEKLNSELETLRNDLKQISGNYENFKPMLEKVRGDMELLKKENEELKKMVNLTEANSSTLDKENLTLTEEINNLRIQESKFLTEKNDFEVLIENLQTEKSNAEQRLSSVMEKAKEVEDSLAKKLESLQVSKEDLSSQLAESESIIQKHRENIAGLEAALKEATTNLNLQMKENNEMKNQLTKLQHDLSKALTNSENESAINELRSGKEGIVQEIKSLDPGTNLTTEKPLKNLFSALLGSIMKKEAEFIQTLQYQIDALEQKLEQEKFEHSEDQKKSDNFIRSLESENEKLQAELVELEKKKERQMEKNMEMEKKMEHYSGNSEIVEKLQQERKTYNQQVDELTWKIQSISSKNKELLNSLEEFANKEKQLKGAFDAKSNENLKLSHEIAQLKIQLEQVSEAYENMNSEAAEKNRKAEQITFLLKQEKDKCSEYKTKLEGLMPEYDFLQDQMKKLKNSIGEYKSKIVSLTESLNLKSTECTKLETKLAERAEMTTKLESEKKHIKQKCNDLEAENLKLTRKLRSSTPGQATLEDLADKNKMLQNNLEGVSNRLIQLQKQNAQYVEEIAELKTKIQSYELNSNRSVTNQTCNGVTNEQTSSLEEEVVRLTKEKEELNNENDDLAKKINELEYEISMLEGKILDLEEAGELNKDSWELKKKLIEAQAEISDYKSNTIKLEEKLKQSEMKILSAEKNLDNMNNKNTELQTKISSLEDKLESLSANSTRSNGPAFDMGLRHQRRSNQFNQNRHLASSGNCECSTSCAEDSNCACNNLKKQIRDLEFEIVNKVGRIATLELQIKCGNFPHEERCKQLEKSNASYKSQLTEAITQLKKMERCKTQAVSTECENCKKQVVHSRSVSTQFPDSLLRMTGIQSGIIWEDSVMRKLEKERDMMKEICRDRKRRLLIMEHKLKKYEELYGVLME